MVVFEIGKAFRSNLKPMRNGLLQNFHKKKLRLAAQPGLNH